MELQDQLAVVTGAASGIGRATAHALAALGAHVVVADIDRDGGEKTVAALREHGARGEFLPIDMTDPASIAAFADALHARRLAAAVDLDRALGGGLTPTAPTNTDPALAKAPTP